MNKINKLGDVNIEESSDTVNREDRDDEVDDQKDNTHEEISGKLKEVEVTDWDELKEFVES